MSLNKFSNDDTGYDLKLNVGADEMKCNTLEVVNTISQGGQPISSYQNIVANYTTTNGAVINGTTQQIGVFRSGNYMTLADNVSVIMDNTNTFFTFGIEFDLPPEVPASGVRRIMTEGSGGSFSFNLGYVVIKTNSTYNQGSGRLGLIFTKSDGTNFTANDQMDCSWEVKLDLGL
jgi:hypothetical protein